MKKILVVDDRIHTLKGLVGILEDEGFEVIQAAGGAEALDLFRNTPDLDVILADLKMPGMGGIELFRTISSLGPAPPFIIMTAYGAVRSAVEALKEGVTEYLIKPLDYEELTIILDKAVRQHALSKELDQLRREVRGGRETFHGLIGTSPKMIEVFDIVRTVGPTDASVFIRGETGTGKELLARAIHMESRRHKKEMICINCAALTESLLEAELFGYCKGAFTGAVTDKKGRLEAADGSTLFLDEIGHMSLSLQAKLLRFLQDMTFEPVGGTSTKKVDVRLISATNQSLRDQIEKGRFLADLLYRIEVIAIHLPPLRDRKEDLPLLVNHFVRRYAHHYQKTINNISPEAMEILMNHSWPGNVREMQNCLARAVILSKSSTLHPEDIPEKIRTAPRPETTRPDKGPFPDIPDRGLTILEMETELIRRTLEKCRGNKSMAARSLGISRKALYQKLSRLKIET